MGDKVNKSFKTKALARVRADIIGNKNFDNIANVFDFPPDPLSQNDLILELGFEIFVALIENGKNSKYFKDLIENHFTEAQVEDLLVKKRFSIFKKAMAFNRFDVLRNMFRFLSESNKFQLIILKNYSFLQYLFQHQKFEVAKSWFSKLPNRIKEKIVLRRGCRLLEVIFKDENVNALKFVLSVVEDLKVIKKFFAVDEYNIMQIAFSFNSPKCLNYLIQNYEEEYNAWFASKSDEYKKVLLEGDEYAFLQTIYEIDDLEMLKRILLIARSLNIEEDFLTGQDSSAIEKIFIYDAPNCTRFILNRLDRMGKLRSVLEYQEYEHFRFLASEGNTKTYRILFEYGKRFDLEENIIMAWNYEAFGFACEYEDMEQIKFLIKEAIALDDNNEYLMGMFEAEESESMNFICQDDLINSMKAIDQSIENKDIKRAIYTSGGTYQHFKTAHNQNSSKVSAFLFDRLVELECLDIMVNYAGFLVGVIYGTSEGGPNEAQSKFMCKIYESEHSNRNVALRNINFVFGDSNRSRFRDNIRKAFNSSYVHTSPNWLTRLLAFSTKIESDNQSMVINRALYFRANLNLSLLGAKFSISPSVLMKYRDIMQKLEPLMLVQKDYLFSTESIVKVELSRKVVECEAGKKIRIKNKTVECQPLPKSVANQVLAHAIGIDIFKEGGRFTEEFTILSNITEMPRTTKFKFSKLFKAHSALNFVDRLNSSLQSKSQAI